MTLLSASSGYQLPVVAVGSAGGCVEIWNMDGESQQGLTRSAFLQSAVAPDFELPDRHGNTVRLSELRGKKVGLIVCGSNIDFDTFVALLRDE